MGNFSNMVTPVVLFANTNLNTYFLNTLCKFFLKGKCFPT